MEPGSILKTMMHSQWVAFDVDEIDTVYDWRAVTVNGATYFLTDNAQSEASAEFEAAVRLFQSVVPEVLTADDPLPERVELIRIYMTSSAEWKCAVACERVFRRSRPDT